MAGVVNLIMKIVLDHIQVRALKSYQTVSVLTFQRHFNLSTFNGQQTEVIFIPLTLNAIKF